MLREWKLRTEGEYEANRKCEGFTFIRIYKRKNPGVKRLTMSQVPN